MKSCAEWYKIYSGKIATPKPNCYASECFIPLPKEKAPPPPPSNCFPLCYSYADYIMKQQDAYMKSQGMERIPCNEAVKDYISN